MGEFTDEEVCKEIALTITPLVDSPHLKFNIMKNTMIFHFASDVSQEEIHDYIIGSLFDLVSGFILSEYTDKVSVYLPKDAIEHLMDLENEGTNVQMSINSKTFSEMDEEQVDEKILALLLDEIKSNVKKPSLDSILEKINEKGMDSLSQFEKDILDSYSKN